jgi:hypothetical protein
MLRECAAVLSLGPFEIFEEVALSLVGENAPLSQPAIIAGVRVRRLLK